MRHKPVHEILVLSFYKYRFGDLEHYAREYQVFGTLCQGVPISKFTYTHRTEPFTYRILEWQMLRLPRTLAACVYKMCM